MTRPRRRPRLPDAGSLEGVLAAAVDRARRATGWPLAAVDSDLEAHGLPALADTTGRDTYAAVGHLTALAHAQEAPR